MTGSEPRKQRAAIVLALVTVMVVGGAAAAFAWHGACSGSMVNLTPVGPYYNGVGVKTSGNSVAVCYDVTDVPSNPSCFTNCGGFVVTITDPNSSSVGNAVTVGGGSTLTGAVNVGATGAEAGQVGGCGGGPGTCVHGTTVYADGIPVGLANYTGVDASGVSVSRTQSTIPIACAGSTCVYGQKVSGGSVKVFVNSTTPTATLPLCVSVGAGVSCP